MEKMNKISLQKCDYLKKEMELFALINILIWKEKEI